MGARGLAGAGLHKVVVADVMVATAGGCGRTGVVTPVRELVAVKFIGGLGLPTLPESGRGDDDTEDAAVVTSRGAPHKSHSVMVTNLPS